ncbi:hypothetical protein B0H63DRAFT_485907 [Podospora didyma]|uniref:Uncharacterized protein n=1 Tax=Podospora didyma TaxID=330526 RepID=A0AAE0K4M9_9PEZI|nr:hypothetical protein B0H63DRAFT_485907 [Podospora didyma]
MQDSKPPFVSLLSYSTMFHSATLSYLYPLHQSLQVLYYLVCCAAPFPLFFYLPLPLLDRLHFPRCLFPGFQSALLRSTHALAWKHGSVLRLFLILSIVFISASHTYTSVHSMFPVNKVPGTVWYSHSSLFSFHCILSPARHCNAL